MIQTASLGCTPRAVVILFRGWVSCRRDGEPLGLTLTGRTVHRPEEIVHLAFACATPASFPDALEDPIVEPLAAGRYRITSGEREWIVVAVAHVHRDVTQVFYAAIPPRSAAWTRRAFWRLVLALAGSRVGRRLLSARVAQGRS